MGVFFNRLAVGKPSSQRQARYLEALQQKRGRRIVVDLDAEASAHLEMLMASGKARTQKEAVCLALREAASDPVK